MSAPHFHWTDLAFGSKQSINDLGATFIAAPRELSTARIKQLIKEYLPQGNLVMGLSQEDYVLGLEDQPQFRMLSAAALEPVLTKVNAAIKAAAPAADSTKSVSVLSYSQRDFPFVLDKLKFRRVVLVNGSWYRAFHLRPEFYRLAQARTPYELVSPFANEAEAKAYVATHQPPAPQLPSRPQTANQMLALANAAARQSFDSAGFQIGVALGRRVSSTEQGGDPQTPTQLYQAIATAFNPVVPYQTYAMHHGASRERHFSPMNDLNHYDTNHAEVELIIQAAREGIDLRDTTLFINLLPCPTCARMLARTDIAEFIYSQDHSAGYAITMLEAAGKIVNRTVPHESIV